MTYRVAFDIAEAGYKSWSFPAFGLIFVVVGAVLVTFRKNLPGAPGKAHPRASAAFAWFFLGFAEVFSVVYIGSTMRDAVAFGLLFAILLFRPQGLFGGVAQRRA